MFDTILVPTDGSETALRAAERAAGLARALDAEIHLLSVVDVDAAAGVFSAGGIDDSFVDRLRGEAREVLRSVEDDLGDAPVAETVVRTGYPPDEILAYAEEAGIDLLVMGTHGRTGPRRYVLGSVTERVVRRSTVPVLTVGPDGEGGAGDGYEEVLIPTDGSDPALAAVAPGLALAGAFDARVHAVNVVDVGDIDALPTFTPPEQLVDRLRTEGEAATGTVVDRATDAGLDAVEEVRIGRPARQLLAYARENDVDLIAMGTAGRSGLGERLLGSTTERVLRRAEMPVLAVRSGAPPTD